MKSSLGHHMVYELDFRKELNEACKEKNCPNLRAKLAGYIGLYIAIAYN